MIVPSATAHYPMVDHREPHRWKPAARMVATPGETAKFHAERATRAIRRSRGDQCPVIHPVGDEHTTRNPKL